jgi:hypothetical protein
VFSDYLICSRILPLKKQYVKEFFEKNEKFLQKVANVSALLAAI